MSESQIPELAIAGDSFDLWLSEIKQIGCSDPLSHFRDNSYGQINLERAHPGGPAILGGADLQAPPIWQPQYRG